MRRAMYLHEVYNHLEKRLGENFSFTRIQEDAAKAECVAEELVKTAWLRFCADRANRAEIAQK